MRLAYGLLVSTLLVSSAHAADYLRGTFSQPAPTYGQQHSQPSFDWSGFYVGANASFNMGTFKPAGSLSGMKASALVPGESIVNMTGVGRAESHGAGWGVYGGYQTMWDDVVVGVEAEYGRTSGKGSRRFAGVTFDDGLLGGTMTDSPLAPGLVTQKLGQYGVLRGKVGVTYGRFLPFITLGLAYGEIDTTVRGLLTYNAVSQAGSLKGSHWSSGYALGAGMEYAFTDNIIGRGHYEMLSIGTNRSGELNHHSFKGGLAAKF